MKEKIDLKISVIENIPPILKRKLDKFSNDNWGEDNNEPDEGKKFFDNHKSVIIAKIGRKIVALLFMHFRKISIDNETVNLGGIGGVVTDKELRRKGIATKILQAAMVEMKRKGVEVSMLCADIDKLGSLYSRAGFVKLGRPYYFIDKEGKEEKETGGMIAPVNSIGLFNKILKSRAKINVGISNF